MHPHKLLIGLTIVGAGLLAQSQKPESAYVFSGAEMFHEHCAVCHGIDGKGRGPAASAFRIRPADLTALARKNGGKFPGAEISKELKSVDQAPHGSHEMPIWGAFFSELSPKSDAVAALRITNLVKYIESLQVK
jgi:mono/diheme cytochrome c family protein